MGTSGSYGGSTKKVWKDARQQVLDLAPGGGGSDGGGSEQPPSAAPLDDLWQAIANALDSDDPLLHAPSLEAPTISLPTLMPWLGKPSAGGGGGGAVHAGGGRQGSGSRRQVVRGAARGGAALGAAYAVRRGDATYLAELGLDLTRLQGLSPLRQCAEILEAVLGEGSHPDELALRRASLEALKEVLTAVDPPNEVIAVRTFVVHYVFEISLVELQRQVNEGALAPQDVAKREQMIRTYLDKRVQTLPLPTGVLQPSELRTRAAALTKEVIRLLRAGTEGLT